MKHVAVTFLIYVKGSGRERVTLNSFRRTVNDKTQVAF